MFRYVPFALRLYRWKIYYDYDYTILSRGTGTFASDLREKLSQVSLFLLPRSTEIVFDPPLANQGVVDYMKKTMPDEYHNALIPKYRKATAIFPRACPGYN